MNLWVLLFHESLATLILRFLEAKRPSERDGVETQPSPLANVVEISFDEGGKLARAYYEASTSYILALPVAVLVFVAVRLCYASATLAMTHFGSPVMSRPRSPAPLTFLVTLLPRRSATSFSTASQSMPQTSE